MELERLVIPAPGQPDFTNNVFLLSARVPGTDVEEVLVIDAAHDTAEIADAVGERRAVAIVLTHGHWDHVGAAPELSHTLGAPILLHPADRPLWDQTHPDSGPDGDLTDGMHLTVGGQQVEIRHTPGHTPGSSVVVVPVPGGVEVCSGDTLFAGGPGATRWDYSSFPGIVESIRSRILSLPDSTVVHPGHGPDTTVGAEAQDVAAWLERGW